MNIVTPLCIRSHPLKITLTNLNNPLYVEFMGKLTAVLNKFFELILLLLVGARPSLLIRAWNDHTVMEKYCRNPLRNVGRNIKCICGSGKKVKKCCGRQRFVPVEWAAKVQILLCELTDRQRVKFKYKWR